MLLRCAAVSLRKINSTGGPGFFVESPIWISPSWILRGIGKEITKAKDYWSSQRSSVSDVLISSAWKEKALRCFGWQSSFSKMECGSSCPAKRYRRTNDMDEYGKAKVKLHN